MNLLIVDDERYIVNYLFALIEEHIEIDLNIQKAYSGSEALEILSISKIDLMLLDIHMPGYSGLELAGKVSASWPRCHIIFLTAYDNFEYIYQANRLSHTSYLLKTESDETILAEVRCAIEKIIKESQTDLLLDSSQSKDRLLTHLMQQNLLREILTGHDSHQICRDLTLAGSDFCLDFSQPVYLAYMVVHLRSIDEYAKNMSTFVLEYLTLAEELLKHSFSYTMLNLNHGNMLWFFQPSKDFSKSIPNELTFLKSCLEDLMNYSMNSLHRNVNLILYPQPVSLDATAILTIAFFSSWKSRIPETFGQSLLFLSLRQKRTQKLLSLSKILTEMPPHRNCRSYPFTFIRIPGPNISSPSTPCGISVKSKKVSMRWKQLKSISVSLQH